MISSQRVMTRQRTMRLSDIITEEQTERMRSLRKEEKDLARRVGDHLAIMMHGHKQDENPKANIKSKTLVGDWVDTFAQLVKKRISSKLSEACDVGNINVLEYQLDALFADLGIDVEFSNHFKQRLRERGCEQGFNVEHLRQALSQFKLEKQKELKKLSDRHVSKDLVLKKFFRDLENVLNVVVGLTPLRQPIRGPNNEKIYSKLSGITVMAKKDFKPKNTDTVVLPTNETLVYNESS